MRSGFTVPEASIYGLVFTIALTTALAQSALWTEVPDVGSVLPSRYVDILALLPVSTNTALALLVIGALVGVSLLLLSHPALGLAATTGVVLATAGYPYGLLRWHRVFVELPSDDAAPDARFWITTTIPVLLLLVGPVVLQIRSLIGRYREKGIEDHELRAAAGHLARLAVQNAALALGFAIAMGFLLYTITRATPLAEQAADYSILLMVIVAALLVAAIGIGTGVFSRRAKAPETTQRP